MYVVLSKYVMSINLGSVHLSKQCLSSLCNVQYGQVGAASQSVFMPRHQCSSNVVEFVGVTFAAVAFAFVQAAGTHKIGWQIYWQVNIVGVCSL